MDPTLKHFRRHNIIVSFWAILASLLFFIEPFYLKLFYALIAVWFVSFFVFLYFSKLLRSDEVDDNKNEILEKIISKKRNLLFFIGIFFSTILLLIGRQFTDNFPSMMIWSVALFTMGIGNLGLIIGMAELSKHQNGFEGV